MVSHRFRGVCSPPLRTIRTGPEARARARRATPSHAAARDELAANARQTLGILGQGALLGHPSVGCRGPR